MENSQNTDFMLINLIIMRENIKEEWEKATESIWRASKSILEISIIIYMMGKDSWL